VKTLLKIVYLEKIIDGTETDCVSTSNDNNSRLNLVEMNRSAVDSDS